MATPEFWVKLAMGPTASNTAHAFATSPDWVDITDYLRSASWSRGRSSTLDDVGPGSGTLRLKNHDRAFEPGYAASDYHPLRPYMPVNIGCTWNATEYSLFYGFAESWSVTWEQAWDDAYSETEVRLVDAIALFNMIHLDLTAGLFSVELSSARIDSVLDTMVPNFPAAMRDTTGGTSVQAVPAPPDPQFGFVDIDPTAGTNNAPVQGQQPAEPQVVTAWAHIQEAVRSHAADRPCFIDRRGYVMYVDETDSGLVFGDDLAAGELKYSAANLDYGVDLIFNVAQVTALAEEADGTPPVVSVGNMQEAVDTQSRFRYQERIHTRSTLNTTDAAALEIAEYVVANYAEPSVRIEGFELRPGKTDDLWDAVITLDLEHTIEVRRRPPGGGNTFVQMPKIVGLDWSLDRIAGNTTIGYTLSGAPLELPNDTVLDNFNRANDPAPVAGWLNWKASGLSLVSNQLAPSATGVCDAIWGTGYGPDVSAYIEIATLPTTADSWFGVVARMAPTPVNGYLVQHYIDYLGTAAADFINIVRYDNWAATIIGGSYVQHLDAGDALGIACVGTSIQAWVRIGGGWTMVGAVTDATYAGTGANTNIGLITYDASSTAPRFDNFGGGTIT